MGSPMGVISIKHGVLHDCPACVSRKHKHHPSQEGNGALPLLCEFYQHELGKWSCEACLRVRPAIDPAHTLEGGCTFAGGGLDIARRMGKEQGEHAKAGPRRDAAIPAGWVAGISLFRCDDLHPDVHVFTIYDKALEEE